jgi:transcriptional regulator with XRE-family HTH domain/quercetin dioxygenase-like cupin family protein
MPVYGSHRTSTDAPGLGQRLRGIRQRRGITLRELAKLTSISAAVLSQLETEQRRLDVAQGVAIAEALGVAVEDLVTEATDLPYQVVREGDLRGREARQVELVSPTGEVLVHSNRFHPLADLFAGRHLEPVLGLIAGEFDRDPSCCAHHEQEFLLVLRGSIEFSIQTPTSVERRELGPGDAVYFWSSLPHSTRSLDARGAETMQVFASAPGSLQAESSWLMPPRAEVNTGTGDRLKVIGRRLRACRTAAEQTVEDVAAVLRVMPRHLELAEAGRRPLPLSALATFAQLSGHPLREFIGERKVCAPYLFVQRADALEQIQPARRREGTMPANVFRPLTTGFPTPLMFPCLVEVPTVDSVAQPHVHHGEEFVHVLAGQLELTIGVGSSLRTETLRSGDWCYFDATVPHVLRGRPINPYDRLSAKAVDVFWCPLGADYLFDTQETHGG